MGWSEFADGCLNGDGPADSVSSALRYIADDARRRMQRAPSGEELLHGLVQV
jgi:hypothetical protein